MALYVFSRKENVYNEFRKQTSSGGFCLNECLMQAGLECLPFGGVGGSGIGRYHGKHSFETFSHPRFDKNSKDFYLIHKSLLKYYFLLRAVIKAGFFGDSLVKIVVFI